MRVEGNKQRDIKFIEGLIFELFFYEKFVYRWETAIETGSELRQFSRSLYETSSGRYIAWLYKLRVFFINIIWLLYCMVI